MSRDGVSVAEGSDYSTSQQGRLDVEDRFIVATIAPKLTKLLGQDKKP